MPDTLITEPELRAQFDIHTDVQSGRVTFAIGAAGRRLKNLVGVTAYTDALLDDGATDAVRRADLDYAEGLLAMHYCLLGLNTQIRPSGVVKTEKIEGETVVSYLTPTEIQQLAGHYLDIAEEVIRPYALLSDVPDAQVEIVETEDA